MYKVIDVVEESWKTTFSVLCALICRKVCLWGPA